MTKSSFNILKNQFIIPFGRLRLKRVRPRDDNPVLIGRESQRAFFVDALTGIGERGAFLVTGRRGVGKSTFVENCLADYRQNVFRRFLGSGVGRSLFDILLLIVFILAVLGVLLASGELLSFLVPALSASRLLWLPMLICVLLALFPFFLGVRAIRTALAIYFDQLVSFMTLVLTIASVFCALFVPPFGVPGEALATIIAGLGWLFFGGSVLHYFGAPFRLGYFVRRDKKRVFSGPKRGQVLWWIFLLPAVICVCGILFSQVLSRWLISDDGAERYFLVGGIGISLIFGTILGNGVATWLIASLKTNQLHGDSELGKNIATKTCAVIVIAFLTFLGLAWLSPVLTWASGPVCIGCFVVSSYLVCSQRANAYLLKEERKKATGLAALLLLFGFIPMPASTEKRRAREKWKIKSEKSPKFFAPPVEAVLLLKGFAFILVSIQLLYPVLPTALSSGSISEVVVVDRELSGEQSNRILCIDPQPAGPCFHDGRIGMTANQLIDVFPHSGAHPDQIMQIAAAEGQLAADLPIQTAMFVDTDTATGWYIAAFLLVVFLFLVEYEWINRPFVNQRQSRALDRAPRRPQQIHHHMDPIWFEVSAKRQWDAVPADERLPFAKYYERAENYDRKNPDLFDRRSELQRSVLRRFRLMEQQTFTYAITQLWLPVIEVNVNLGFDALDHRGVTHAMLDGLRRSYRRKFVSLRSSPYAILRALGLTFVIMIGVVQLGEAWFDMPSDPAHREIWQSVRVAAVDNGAEGRIWPWNDPETPSRYSYLCDYLRAVRVHEEAPNRTPLAADLICQTYTPIATAALELLYAELVPFSLPVSRQDHADPETDLAFWFTHRNQAPPFAGQNWEQSLAIRGYHVALAILLFGLLERFARRFPVLPYRNNLQRIEALLDDLTLRRADSRNARAGVGVGSLFELSRGVETSREALDPRSVELKLLSLLNDLRGKSGDRERGRRISFTMPMPDIHFVFDELDKLSGIASPDLGTSDSVEQDREALDSERQRAYRLRSLLSDMKRVISSAPARFIFVGGRTLHDEWIRDQNRLGTTQPLLTSIFDHEIYLPSLLVDFSRARFSNALVATDTQAERALDLRIREFLINAYHSARVFQQTLKESRYVPFIGLAPMDTTAMKFLDSSVRPRERFEDIGLIDARRQQVLKSVDPDEPYHKLLEVWREEFFNIFVGFLAYRSAGSPKKLNELLSDLVRPSGALLHPEIGGNVNVPASQDALVIDEKELYRMQLINSLFRHIETSFGTDLLQRDDKITINTIFMFDFLMKMHNRAFSWSSIERLDELAHIHRAPDLRRLFDSVISNSAERYFHRVLNGLFTFRFRSELAIEIRYLSRVSQTEMAALNFTLDESQELKATFTRMLENSGDSNPDLMIALGELYEFDQAYDIARDHYERAMRAIDDEFVRLNGAHLSADNKLQDALNEALDGRFVLLPNPDISARDLVRSERPRPPDDAFLHGILSQSDTARNAIRLNLPWGIRRLRLMLQIGLTYEQQADEERAQAQYQSAQLFASTLLRSALEKAGNGSGPDTKAEDSAPLSHVIKHLPLIFQPVFASAWVAEKLENGVDTSLSIVEREVSFLRANLPFVKLANATENEQFEGRIEGLNKRDARSNHLLVMAELHNKAGDLDFFKGRAAYNIKAPNFPDVEPRRQGGDGAGTEGYLFRAHYHYAMALHEARRFVFYRRHVAKDRLALLTTQPFDEGWRPLDSKNLPTFVYQTVASSMVDLAEVTLARSSVLEAWRELEKGKGAEPVGRVFRHGFDIKKRLEDIEVARRQASNPEKAKVAAAHGYAFELFSTIKGEIDAWFALSDAETRDISARERSVTNDLEALDTRLARLLQDEVRANNAGRKLTDEAQRTLDEAKANVRWLAAAKIVQDYLGSWRDGTGEEFDVNRLQFGHVKANHERLLISLMFSLYGGRAVNRSNYPDASSFESQITAEHVVRLLRSIRGLLAVAQKDRSGPALPKGASGRLAELFDVNDAHLNLISILIEIGLFAISRLIELKELAYPEAARTDEDGTYRTTDTSKIVAAALTTAMRNLLSNISALVESSSKTSHRDHAAHLEHWKIAMEVLKQRSEGLLSPGLLENVDAYDKLYTANPAVPGSWEDHRRDSRALMIYLVTHHRYPALTNLTLVKALVDDVSIIDGLGLGYDQEALSARVRDLTSQSELAMNVGIATDSVGRKKKWYNITSTARRNAQELINTGGIWFAHSKKKAAEAERVRTRIAEHHARIKEGKDWFRELIEGEKLLDAPMHYPPSHIAETASLLALTCDGGLAEGVSRRFRWKAEQSFTMGRQYYQNISRLIYLFDDFNDRRRHSIHAGQMSMADMLALYRYIFDKRSSPEAEE